MLSKIFRRLVYPTIALCLFASAGCGSENESGSPESSSITGSEALVPSGAFQESYELPFGLNQVEATTPVGRPLIDRYASGSHNGEPNYADRLQAVYRITSEDLETVFESWVDQLGSLNLTDLTVGGGECDAGSQASGGVSGGGGPLEGDFANLRIWETTGDPILTLSVSRFSDNGSGTNPPEVFDYCPTDLQPVEDNQRMTGDVLFSEQGTDIHVPEGALVIMPTLPIFAGTGGSYSIVASADPEATIQALYDEAKASSEYSEGTGPETEVLDDGTEIVSAWFNISAGGWGFNATSIRAPGDELATIYIDSAAD